MPELDEREEKAANMKLSDIAATVVNPVAGGLGGVLGPPIHWAEIS